MEQVRLPGGQVMLKVITTIVGARATAIRCVDASVQFNMMPLPNDNYEIGMSDGPVATSIAGYTETMWPPNPEPKPKRVRLQIEAQAYLNFTIVVDGDLDENLQKQRVRDALRQMYNAGEQEFDLGGEAEGVNDAQFGLAGSSHEFEIVDRQEID